MNRATTLKTSSMLTMLMGSWSQTQTQKELKNWGNQINLYPLSGLGFVSYWALQAQRRHQQRGQHNLPRNKTSTTRVSLHNYQKSTLNYDGLCIKLQVVPKAIRPCLVLAASAKKGVVCGWHTPKCCACLANNLGARRRRRSGRELHASGRMPCHIAICPAPHPSQMLSNCKGSLRKGRSCVGTHNAVDLPTRACSRGF